MPEAGAIPKRRLGKTNIEVSILGLGGSHIGYETQSDEGSIRLIRTAIDAGITFLDNSWGYHNGRSEERMGVALQDGYRDNVFLMTKVDARDKAGAMHQLEESLRRLKTDYLDLWQIHEVVYEDDPELISGPDGALAALDEAKKSGKARFVGFTGHKHPSLHLQLLDMYDFDASQMPLNILDAHFKSFEKQVLPVMLQKDVGVIGMKSLGGSNLLRSEVVVADEAIRYALSLPTATVVVGMQNMDLLQKNISIARDFQPLTQEQAEAILAKTAPLDVVQGGYEPYKTSNRYDSGYGRKSHALL